MIAAPPIDPSLPHRHAVLRQRGLDYIGQGVPGIIKGDDGRVFMTRSQIPDGSTPDSEMPDDLPISTLLEKTMSEIALKRGIKRMMREEEAAQDGAVPTMHRMADGQLEIMPLVPLSLRPGAFQVAHMGRNQWLVQGGPTQWAGYENLSIISGEQEDKVVTLDQGWIVADVHGSTWTDHGTLLIDHLEIVAAKRGFETDYNFVRDEFQQGTERMTKGMVPIAYVIAPGQQSNKGPVIFGGLNTGWFINFIPSEQLFKAIH